MEKSGENSTLYVQMFGNFSMIWNGRQLIGGTKSAETQFAWLMQLLLHNRENGISRNRLEEILFEGRDIADLHHAAVTPIPGNSWRYRQE